MGAMTRDRAKEIRGLLDELLLHGGPQLDDAGVSIRIRNGTIRDTSVSFKVEVSLVSEDGTVETPQRDAYRQLATEYGLRPEWLDETFESGGSTFTITGLNARATAKPVTIKRQDGRLMKCSEDMVILAMGQKKQDGR